MNSIAPFAYGDHAVRVIDVDGEPWWILADVCKVLGIGNPTMVAKRVSEDALSQAEVIDSMGRTQQATIVSEAGLYEVVIRSDSPQALPFRRWITHEVIPTIRRHGMYATPAAVDAMLADPDTMIRVLTDLKAERARRAELEAQAAKDAPKVLFADAVAASPSTILIGELAKILRGNGVEIGQNRLFSRLREDGYLIRREGSDYNTPTQRAMELGLFRIKETAITHSDGHVTVSKTTKVTGKGQQYFIRYFLSESA